MKKTKITDKLKQRRKKKGFTLVELVVVILIIAILASATFLGGATVIKQARITKTKSDLRQYSTYMEDMFYNHPGYASNGIDDEDVVDKVNEYLTADLWMDGTGAAGSSKTLRDAWDNQYSFTYDKVEGKADAAVLVWSNGANQESESSLSGITPTVENDDIAVLIKVVNGEVFTQTVMGPEVPGKDNNDGQSVGGGSQRLLYSPGLYATGHAGDTDYLLVPWESLGLEKSDIEMCSNNDKEGVIENIPNNNAQEITTLLCPAHMNDEIQITFGKQSQNLKPELCLASTEDYSPAKIALDELGMTGDLVLPGCEITSNVANASDIITSIGENAFEKCDTLTAIIMPNTIVSIGDYAFKECSNLASITIPDSVTSIGISMFDKCDKLTSINVGSANTILSSENGILFDKDKIILVAYPSVTGNYEVPATIMQINRYAFENCTNLTSITIPNTIMAIHSSTFKNCINLQSITIPNGVKSIGTSAFKNCKKLISITIPDSVTVIGNWAFENCTSLKSITIPKSVTETRQAFYGSCLESVIIQDGAISIYDETFSNCRYLTSITIPSSVKSIGADAFSECGNLTSITFGGTKTQWNTVSKNENWLREASVTSVICTDGEVIIER